MIIDAHLHVWRAMPDYPDPAATTVSPVSDVPIELLNEYMDEHGVERAVLVQPMYPGEDNSYVADCAAAQPNRFAAVCVVDPRKPDAPDRLEYWVRERGCRGLRLRPRLAGEAQIFGDPSTYPLWERAGQLGTVINLLANPEHLPTVAALAERFPNVTIVIDHMGQPDPQSGVASPAFQSLLALARFPQVYVKTSGYYYFSRQPYPYLDCHDLFRAVYERFGPARLIWGSDFPHVLLKSVYGRTLKLYFAVFHEDFNNDSDLDLIMGLNAARLYWR
jgi:predicted TIM-barrel fold metal-dependent hydrolase